MFPVGVVPVVLHEGLQGFRRQLAIFLRHGQHLVAAVFDGSGFMNIHMAGGRCYYALIGPQHRIDDRGIGLGTPHQEMDFCFRSLAGFPDPAAGTF